MYLGQMSSGDDAVRYLEKGTELMVKLHHDSSDQSVLSAEIASAYCALAEVYLTDSWYEVDYVHPFLYRNTIPL